MTDPLPDATRRFVALCGDAPDEIQQALQAHAEAERFPIIGPTVGGLLQAVAAMTRAETVFEFGSGFGYSASWFARGMDGGTIVLTEDDPDELERARETLEAADYAPSFAYEGGDAMRIVERYDGPFDVVLVDHAKQRYADAFDLVREKLAPGGVVVADNMTRGPMAFEDVLAGLEGEPTPDDTVAAVVDYLETVRDDDAFATVLVPTGNGVSLAVKRG